MAAHLIDGKSLALSIREQIGKDVAQLAEQANVTPGLAAILVGDDPASAIYVKNKKTACGKAGIYADENKLPASTTQSELLALIEKLNADPKIHGILVQLPLPKHINSKVILESVSPEKDVDGFHPYNVGRLVAAEPVFVPCTPKGVMRMIQSTGLSKH